MTSTAQPLTCLAPGQVAIVADIAAPEETRLRLLELGFVVGTPVELIRFAPLGGPVEIRVRGYHLTLRLHEAEFVRVQPHA